MVLHCNSFLWWKVVDFSVNKREQKAFVKWLLLQRIFQHFHFKVHFVKAYSHIHVIFVGSCRAKSSFKNKNQNSSKLAQLFLSPRYETVHKRSLGTLFYFSSSGSSIWVFKGKGVDSHTWGPLKSLVVSISLELAKAQRLISQQMKLQIQGLCDKSFYIEFHSIPFWISTKNAYPWREQWLSGW